MRKIDDINIKNELSQEDFSLLFTSQLELNDDEMEKIENVYFPTYMTFLSHGVDPLKSWSAIKNLFISQETQVGERMNKNKK